MDDLDHRNLGPRLDLWHIQEDAPGMVFWHPRGNSLYRILEDYIRRKTRRLGYAEVRTPQLLPRELWIQSGHWEKFGAHMFNFAHGERPIALKPMACPCHVQIFNRGLRFWRDLPLRYAEWQCADRLPLGHGQWQRNSPARCRIGGARAGRHFGCDGHRNRGAVTAGHANHPDCV